MSAIAAVAAIGIGVSAYQNNKAMQQAKKAGEQSQVDIQALDQQARGIAQRNAQESAALEASMTPEVPALRKAANEAVLGDVGTSGIDEYGRSLLSHVAENPMAAGRTPLLQAAIAKAKADLALGGRLPHDVQNAVSRSSLETAGGVAGGGNLGLGRDVVARDIGLTSLDLEHQRLATALQAGGLEQENAQYNTDIGFNNRASTLNAVNLLNQLQQARAARNLNAATYGESIARPIVGLDPSAVANLAVGNANNAGAAASNAANIYGRQSQSYLNLTGQLAGGLLQYNATKKPSSGGGGQI